MTTWEYVTHLIPFQPGPPVSDGNGGMSSGWAGAAMSKLGQEGWELVTAFPWQVQTARVAAVQNGAETPGVALALYAIFKRPAGANLREPRDGEQTAAVGYPRY